MLSRHQKVGFRMSDPEAVGWHSTHNTCGSSGKSDADRLTKKSHSSLHWTIVHMPKIAVSVTVYPPQETSKAGISILFAQKTQKIREECLWLGSAWSILCGGQDIGF